jgi:predicted nucleic acid-binding protein
MERSAKGEVRAITSTIVVAEALHRMMIVEAVEKRGFDTAREAAEYLQNHPDFVKTLKKHLPVPSDLARMKIDIKPVDHVDLHNSKRVRRDHGFMTNDSLVLAVMKRYKVIHLATNDRDFERVPDIKVWAPTA